MDNNTNELSLKWHAVVSRQTALFVLDESPEELDVVFKKHFKLSVRSKSYVPIENRLQDMDKNIFNILIEKPFEELLDNKKSITDLFKKYSFLMIIFCEKHNIPFNKIKDVVSFFSYVKYVMIQDAQIVKSNQILENVKMNQNILNYKDKYLFDLLIEKSAQELLINKKPLTYLLEKYPFTLKMFCEKLYISLYASQNIRMFLSYLYTKAKKDRINSIKKFEEEKSVPIENRLESYDKDLFNVITKKSGKELFENKKEILYLVEKYPFLLYSLCEKYNICAFNVKNVSSFFGYLYYSSVKN